MIGGLILWRKIYKKVITIVFLSLKLEYERSIGYKFNFKLNYYLRIGGNSYE